MLGDLPLVGFVPTTDLDRAVAFYRDVLGLSLRHADGFAAVFDAGGRTLRVTVVGELQPQPFTTAGWEVPDVGATVRALGAAGVGFERFPPMEQDELGVWTTPGGDRVAWFRDADGNLLSLTGPA